MNIAMHMAGQNQIWEHNLLDATTRVFSGDGYERNLNGSSLVIKMEYALRYFFNIHWGLFCGNDGEIFIADSYNHKVDNSNTFELLWFSHAVYLIEKRERD
ncbi:hypothetical protein AAZX31_15G194300 [Glycine max]